MTTTNLLPTKNRFTPDEVEPKAVSRVLRMIRPAFRADGGDISLVDVDDRTVVVRLGVVDDSPFPFDIGSGVLERIIRSRIPQIERLDVVN
jgi:hypothetical protein